MSFSTIYRTHCANITDSETFLTHSAEAVETAIQCAQSMLDYALRSNATLLLLSTMAVYGQCSSASPPTEDEGGYLDTMNVRNSYPEAKRLAEALGAAYASEMGLHVMVARLAQAFGLEVSYSDRRVFAEFARDCVESKDIVLLTTGEKRNMYLSTEDAVAAILTILGRGEAGWAYNVASQETIAEPTCFPVRDIDFDGMTLMAPNDCDAYLHNLDGDYLQLPPEEDRFSHLPLILDFGDGINVMTGEQYRNV